MLWEGVVVVGECVCEYIFGCEKKKRSQVQCDQYENRTVKIDCIHMETPKKIHSKHSWKIVKLWPCRSNIITFGALGVNTY